MDLNRHEIIGRVGQDPRISATRSGVVVAKFSVATSYVYKKEGEKQQETTWHNVVVYGKNAELCQNYVTKGSLLFVSGRSSTRSFVSDEGAEKVYTEIIADKVLMLGSKKENQTKTTSNFSDKEDIPF